MNQQAIRDWTALALTLIGFVVFGLAVGYSTCQISHHHYRSCDDGSTRCMQ